MVMTASIPRRLMVPQRGQHFPVALRRSFRNPFSARGPTTEAGHLGGDSAFLQKHQLFRREPAENLEKALPPLAVGFGIPFARVE